VLSSFNVGSGLHAASGFYSTVNASSAKGTSVVAFLSTDSTTNPTNWEIDAQLYNSTTGATIGSPIFVWTSRYPVYSPTVAMNGSGNFVVAWQNTNGSGNSLILGARFTSNGAPLNLLNPFNVANYSGSSTAPSAAIDQNGNFVVSFTYQNHGASQSQIYAYKSNWANTQTTTFGVATRSGGFYRQAEIAMAPSGAFSIAYAYQSATASGTAIYLNSYAAGATSPYAIRLLDPSASNTVEFGPSLATDNAGDLVVVWDEESKAGYLNLLMRQVGRFGSGSIVVLTSGANHVYDPTVAMNPVSGDFAIALQVTGVNPTLVLSSFKANGSLIGGGALGPYYSAAMSIDTYGDLILTYTSGAGNPYFSYGEFAHFA
jgi:hypothetical protein